MAFREYEGIVYSTTLFLCVLVLPFHYLDTQTYYFFSEDGIVYSDYWPARQFAIDYEDVVRIEIGCKLSPEGGSSRDLNYTVFFDETHSADILGSEAWAGNLDAVAEVHRRFRAAGVPTMRQADFGFLPWQDRIGYQEDCNEAVFSVFGERRGARIAEILRLDRPGTP